MDFVGNLIKMYKARVHLSSICDDKYIHYRCTDWRWGANQGITVGECVVSLEATFFAITITLIQTICISSKLLTTVHMLLSVLPCYCFHFFLLLSIVTVCSSLLTGRIFCAFFFFFSSLRWNVFFCYRVHTHTRLLMNKLHAHWTKCEYLADGVRCPTLEAIVTTFIERHTN